MRELEGRSGTQAQPGGRAGAGHSLWLSAQDGQSRRQSKPKSSRERRHLVLLPHFQMDGEGIPNRLLGNGGRRQKGHRRTVPRGGLAGQAGTLRSVASGLSAEVTAGLPEGLQLTSFKQIPGCTVKTPTGLEIRVSPLSLR